MANYNLDRFIDAQKESYKTALEEIKAGEKQSHWMWFIFPQLKGLGMSYMANCYGIRNLEEAKEYLKNDYLRNNLLEISEALLELESDDATKIFGTPDDIKLRSSMTLFALISSEGSIFHKVLDKFFTGSFDEKTIELLKNPQGNIEDDSFVDFIKEKCSNISEDEKKARFEKLRSFLSGEEKDWK